MNPSRTIAAGIAGTTLIMGGVDASVLNETALERVEQVAGERVEARQVGNVVEAKFPWKDAQPIKVSYDMGEPSMAEKLADKRGVEVRFGKKKDGELEYGLILNEIPDTNTFCYGIENADDYNWHKQPPLTQEEIDGGAHRPEHVVNSFAVYHKEKKNHVLGEENYATGKAFHRYRPQAVDADGNTLWGDSNFADGQVCDTFDDKWFNEAVYPVKI